MCGEFCTLPALFLKIMLNFSLSELVSITLINRPMCTHFGERRIEFVVDVQEPLCESAKFTLALSLQLRLE